jgi:hypothetical protein
MPATDELERRIREHMKNTLKQYYEQHPERLFDERGNEAVKISLQGLDEIFKILDEYEIRSKKAGG